MRHYQMGKVYFLHDESAEAVKIGWSLTPEHRCKELQAGNPRRMVLLGCLPGGQAEEKRLHRLFHAEHIHREWFRATADLLRRVRLMLAGQGEARTVQDELERRQGCRYGLGGVLVGLRGQPGERRVIRSSRWEADESLGLVLISEEEWAAIPKGFVVVRGSDIVVRIRPTTPAGECVLLSDWPVVCDCWLSGQGEYP